MEEEKRKRGRPRLSEEEKARRAALRKAEKQAQPQEPKPVAEPPKPKMSPEEIEQIKRVTKIMGEADERKRQQIVLPKIEVEQQGNVELVHVARSKEPTIEDEPKDTRPPFVQDDERGWEPVP